VTRNLAVVLARGGSKRIPRKNIREFASQPLISWPILTLIDSGLFEDIVVSTDDVEIADIAKLYGATVPFMRTDELSDDVTPMVPVINHSIAEMGELGKKYDAVLCVYATSVFVTKNDIKLALELLNSTNHFGYVSGIVRYSHPIQRALQLESNGKVSMVSPENTLVRTQDLEDRFHDSGQFYWGRVSAWMSGASPLTSTLGLVLPSWRVVDIDTEEDWARAEKTHGHLSSSELGERQS